MDDAEHSRRRFLEGRLGIRQWLDRVKLSQEYTGIFAEAINYTIRFVIEKNGNIGGRFILIPVGSNFFNGTIDLGGRHRKTHELSIAFTPIRPATPLLVKIVEDKRAKAAQLDKQIRAKNGEIDAKKNRIDGLVAKKKRLKKTANKRALTPEEEDDEQELSVEIPLERAKLDSLRVDKARLEGQRAEAEIVTTTSIKREPPRVGPSGVDERTQRELENIQSQQVLRSILNRLDEDRLLP